MKHPDVKKIGILAKLSRSVFLGGATINELFGPPPKAEGKQESGTWLKWYPFIGYRREPR